MKRANHSYGRQKSGESQDIEIDLWFCMVQYGSFLVRDIVPVAGASRNMKTHQVPPRRSSVFLLDIIEMKRAIFCPHIRRNRYAEKGRRH